MGRKKRIPWNRGLTKETDARVAKNAESVSKSTKGRAPWNKGLTKETDKRVARNAKKQEKPKEIRVCKYSKCDNTFECMVDSSRKYCNRKCYWKDLKGRKSWNSGLTKETDERVRKNSVEASERMLRFWGDPEYKKYQLYAMIKGRRVKPNKPEKFLTKLLQQLFPNQYKYVGDGEFILAGKNPDFINVNGQRKIIELFGNYWHTPEEEQQRINLFSRYGYQTLVIWDYELSDIEVLNKKIIEFCK